jgi:hypothetical protein
MVLENLLAAVPMYIIFVAGGFFIQSILPSGKRFIIYPASFALGVVAGWQSNYYTLSLGIGMISRAVVGGHWNCIVLEAASLAAGILVGAYFL